MADQKISQLTSLTGANTASGDLVTVVDISDTTMGASGTNKKMTLAEFQASPVSAGTANGVVYLNGTKVPSSGSVLTFDGTYFNANGLRLAGADVTNTIYQATGALGISTGSASGIIFSPNATARMALDASGNLGVGTVSPASRLHSYAGTNISANHAIFGDSAIGYWNFSSGGSPSNRVIARGYDSSAVENIRLDPSSDSFLLGGNLGVGTVSPTVKLHVSSTATEVIFQDSDTAKGSSLAALLSYHGSDGRAGYIGYPADSSLYIYNQNNTAILFGTNNAEKMRLDASGNLGLGVTPSAWGSNFKAMDIGGNAAIAGYSNSMYQLANAYAENAAYRYKASTFSSAYLQTAGQHQWFTAPSGTAGNVISFTQAMLLDASGNLGLGVTPSAWNTSFYKAIQLAPTASIFGSTTTPAVWVGANTFKNSSNQDAYISSAVASQYAQVSGVHAWYTAPSGTAGNVISFTQAMTLDASGNLGLNTSTFGTSAAGVLSLGTGTAPTTGPADTVQLFSVDRSAGNTIPAIRCEGSGVTSAGITSTAVTNKIAVQVNGTIYYLLATTNAT